jgi:CBS-domain-containing membrane protein
MQTVNLFPDDWNDLFNKVHPPIQATQLENSLNNTSAGKSNLSWIIWPIAITGTIVAIAAFNNYIENKKKKNI